MDPYLKVKFNGKVRESGGGGSNNIFGCLLSHGRVSRIRRWD